MTGERTDLATLVAAYAAAKSEEDVAGALAVCDDAFGRAGHAARHAEKTEVRP